MGLAVSQSRRQWIFLSMKDWLLHDFQVIPATKEIASRLKIEEVEQIVFLDDGRIFEYSKSRHRGDRFELHTVSVQ